MYCLYSIHPSLLIFWIFSNSGTPFAYAMCSLCKTRKSAQDTMQWIRIRIDPHWLHLPGSVLNPDPDGLKKLDKQVNSQHFSDVFFIILDQNPCYFCTLDPEPHRVLMLDPVPHNIKRILNTTTKMVKNGDIYYIKKHRNMISVLCVISC